MTDTDPSRETPVEPGRLRDPHTGRWHRKELLHYLRGWTAVLVSLAVVGAGLWWGGSKVWDLWMDFRTQDDYVGPGVEQIDVNIHRGATMTEIGDQLVEVDVIKSTDTFLAVAKRQPELAAQIQAGTYSLMTQLPAEEAFLLLSDPANLVRNMLRVPEGMRLSAEIKYLANETGIPLKNFQTRVDNPGKLKLPAWGKDNPEGFLFPDTYELPTDPSATDVLLMTTTHFATVSAEIDFENKAKASPAGDPYSALIMASLVEREAVDEENRRKVARVFYNRLAQGMALQSDATVAYANNVTGRVTTTPEERQIDSPYNTYLEKNAGKLPPGPITSPARSALEAAVDPAEGDWLFFVTVNLDTGETEYNTTYEGHLQSVEKWQQWCQTSDKC
ncbi:MAG: endolytic transglycosylase MltG [Propioniciclava sp.]